MRYYAAPLFFAAIVAAAASSSAAVPHRSHHRQTVGNGFGFSVFDSGAKKLTWFTEFPYAHPSEGKSTRNLAYDAYFGLRASGGGGWLVEKDVESTRYVDNSNVAEITQRFGPLRARTHVFSPWGLESPAVVLALEITNTSSIAQPDAAAYALLNFHLGNGAPNPDAKSESITWDGANDTFTETGPSGLALKYVSLVPSKKHGASPNNPYSIVKAGGDLIDTASSGTIDDAVAGLQWSLEDLAAGETRWVGVVVTLGSVDAVKKWQGKRTPKELVQDELTQWEAWRKPPPAGLSDVEKRVYRQSETVLRMAQSREPAPSKGQILASLPPGIWWITWVRDMSYAVAALAKSGHLTEAGLGIDFWKGAKVGAYRKYVGTDYYLSVVRYFGNGDEESDFNDKGPNIEFDGFGLAMWAAHLAKRNDLDKAADSLRNLLDPTGLIKADSSIWEVHWEGEQKRYAYTSITAARGLCDANDAKTAVSVRDAIVKNLKLPTGGIAQSYEELTGGKPARDAAVIEAINFGLINPHGELAKNTVAEMEKLRVPTAHGFFRNDDGGGYDMQEWVFVDLRIASALQRMGRKKEADALLAWITNQAAENDDLIPELMHRENADYFGATPMVGFGAGAYILALHDKVSPPPKTDPCFPAEGPDVAVPIPTEDAGPVEDTGTAPIEDSGGVTVDAGGSDTSAPNVPLKPEDKSQGGCSVGPSNASSSWVAIAFAMLGLVACRRRRGIRACVLVAMLSALAIGCGSKAEEGVQPNDASSVLPDGALPTPDGAIPDAAIPDVPVVGSPLPYRDCKTSFSMPLGRDGKVELIGEWDGFKTRTPMSDGLGSGVYRTELTLPAGDYGYKFVIDGSDFRLDPTHGYTRYVGGVENSRIVVEDCKLPRLDSKVAEALPDGTITLVLQYVDGAEKKGIDASSVKVTMNKAAVSSDVLTLEGATGRIGVRTKGLAPGKYTFAIDAKDTTGRAARTLLVPMWVEAEPFEWNDGTMYFVFTDRFRNGNPANDAPIAGIDPRANYQGGDLAGVLAALKEGYFDALGVRSIWLSPVNTNTNEKGKGGDGRDYSGYHGYWPTEPRAVEEHFGTLDDLRAVTAEAHKRGIRILFDLVQNQVHQEHPYVKDKKGAGWFNGDGSCVCGGPSCSWDDHPIDCWFTNYLPDVNWSNMGAVDAMIDDAIWWLVEADADGFRVDAVKHMNDIASTTLRRRIHDTLETGNARYYLVGETFTGGDDGGRDLIRKYVSDRALTGQFDFPLFWGIDYAFAAGGGSMADLDAATKKSDTSYGPSALMSPFLGNHDVTRFLSRAAKQIGSNPVEQAWTAPPPSPDSDDPYDRMFLAFAFLLGQPGVPLIYYGDEMGLPGTADPDNRRMMKSEAMLSPREKKLFDRVKILAKARGTLPGLRRGARRTLFVDGDGYVFARGASKNVVLVAINRGTTARTAKVTVPADLGVPDGTMLKDLLGGPSVTVSGGAIDVPFGAKNAALYVR